jgi:hypothetical protein
VDPWLHDGIPEIDIHDDDEVRERPASFVSAARAPAKSPDFPRLVTAAELARAQEEDDAAPRYHPEIFRQGMLVEHPTYGIGTIASLSGAGIKKTALVDFGQYGKRKFRLSHSPLAPVEME